MQTETTGKTPRKASQMYGNKPPAARRLAQFPQQLADGGTVKDEERAVFGLYPQMTDNQRTTYATADKLRSGVVATGPNTFATALTPKPIAQPAIRGGGDGRRMNAQQDPRSMVYAGRPQTADTAAVAPAQAAAQGQAPAATVATNAPAALSSGSVSAQDDAAAGAVSRRGAADALAQMPNAPAPVTAPTVRNSTNDWAARKALENAATSASSITNNGGRFDRSGPGDSVAMAGFKAMLGTDQALQQAQVGLEQEGMRQNGGLQRETIQQQGSTARDAERNAISRDELGLRKTAAGFQNRAAARMESLGNVLLDPKATPEQRKQAQEYLQALAISGKEPSPQYKSHVMPAIRNADGSTTEGGVYQENTRTGEGRWVKPQGDGKAQQAMPKPASKAEFDALPKGARFTDPNGQVRIK